LPPRLSFAQDHWGYFNGKSNSTLVPRPDNPNQQKQFITATANREVDTVFSIKGMLVKVQYPTGGYDSILYESNTYHTTKQIYPATQSVVNGIVVGTGTSTEVSKSLSSFTVGFTQTVDVNLRVTNRGSTTPLKSQNGALVIVIVQVNKLRPLERHPVMPTESIPVIVNW
jgi:hypothetical protein